MYGSNLVASRLEAMAAPKAMRPPAPAVGMAPAQTPVTGPAPRQTAPRQQLLANFLRGGAR
jgi:hypothetical protein